VERVLRNSGAHTPGIDEMTKKDYATPAARKQLRDEVKQTLRTYTSQPVRRVFIPKPHKPHGERPLGIPTIVDRVAQDAVRAILEPIYESKQHPHSYGFRPYRCAHHANERIRFLIANHQYHWVVEMDIKGFFDHVDQEILLDILRRDIHDRKLLKIIRSMLKAGLVYEGVYEETESGTPQGGIASPILGNIYLSELDEFIANKYEHLSPRARSKAPIPCFIVRYADDAVILCKSKEHAEILKVEVAEFLREHLHLQLSEEKTLVTHADDGFDFLGFNIRRWKRQGQWNVLVKPSRKAIQKFKGNMARDSRALQTLPGVDAIAILNGKIRGFAEYFRRGNSKDTFLELDYYLWWLMFRRIQQKTREPPSVVARKYLHYYNEAANFPQYRKYTARNFGFKDDDKNVHILDQLGYYKIEYPDKCSQKNPYVPEERDWLDANKKLRGLMKAQQVRYLQRLYGSKQNWAFYRTKIVQRQEGRCARCKRHLTQAYTHVYHWQGVAENHTFEEGQRPENLVALCIPCYRKTRQFSRTRAL